MAQPSSAEIVKPKVPTKAEQTALIRQLQDEVARLTTYKAEAERLRELLKAEQQRSRTMLSNMANLQKSLTKAEGRLRDARNRLGALSGHVKVLHEACEFTFKQVTYSMMATNPGLPQAIGALRSAFNTRAPRVSEVVPEPTGPESENG
jgi:hypothetical protein